jgi:hypothetical protein
MWHTFAFLLSSRRRFQNRSAFINRSEHRHMAKVESLGVARRREPIDGGNEARTVSPIHGNVFENASSVTLAG